METKKKRIDLLLLEQGLATSRKQAQDLIAAGRVLVVQSSIRNVVEKPSQTLSEELLMQKKIELQVLPLPQGTKSFVSRAGHKLQAALDLINLDVQDMRVLDIGISTGGFTDCLLQAGAKRVIGVDVGHGQLAEQLRRDPRVELFEGINARHLKPEDIRAKRVNNSNDAQDKLYNNALDSEFDKFDLVVIDVSFISLSYILPVVPQFIRKADFLCKDSNLQQPQLLALIKPQFEVGAARLGKGGVVKKQQDRIDAVEKIVKEAEGLGFADIRYFECPVAGADGNREYFLAANYF